MNTDWSADFSYEYFKKLLQAIKKEFEPLFFSDLLQNKTNTGKPGILLRHDVDLDLRKALDMAETEYKLNICANYMVMLDSPLYNLADNQSLSIVKGLISRGHEIGLHTDLTKRNQEGDFSLTFIESYLRDSCERMENLIKKPVRSISFHRPSQQSLDMSLTLAGRVNSYARELTGWYLSDSRRRWRAGEPLPQLTNPKGKLLQLLIHPIWWGNPHGRAEDILQAFFEKSTQGLSPESVRSFDKALGQTLSIKRSG